MAKKRNNNKKILKGKFYSVHEGSPTGHPGMIFWKNDNRNLYLAITTDTGQGRHRKKLIHSIDSELDKTYVQNRPVLAKRKNIGGEYKDMKFHKDDKPTIKVISRAQHRQTKDIKSRDRRYLKKLRKKPRY